MDCNFIKKEDGTGYICVSCNYESKVYAKRNCGGVPFIKRATNFVKAVVPHVFHGRPKSNEEEIQRRLEICRNCPGKLFKPLSEDGKRGVCTHGSCGCNISDVQTFLNKLAWEDQQCPIGAWVKEDKTKENGV